MYRLPRIHSRQLNARVERDVRLLEASCGLNGALGKFADGEAAPRRILTQFRASEALKRANRHDSGASASNSDRKTGVIELSNSGPASAKYHNFGNALLCKIETSNCGLTTRPKEEQK